MVINEDEFWDTYGPFEIYEAETDALRFKGHTTLWTVVEADNDFMHAIPGFRRSGAAFWITSAVPWPSEDTTVVWFDPTAMEDR